MLAGKKMLLPLQSFIIVNHANEWLGDMERAMTRKRRVASRIVI
jgi:hypothetical protein